MPEHLVFIVDDDFVPRRIEVIVGEYVTWENRTGATHSATRTQSPSFDTGDIRKGERSAPMQMTSAGNLQYATKGPGLFEGMITAKLPPGGIQPAVASQKKRPAKTINHSDAKRKKKKSKK